MGQWPGSGIVQPASGSVLGAMVVVGGGMGRRGMEDVLSAVHIGV